MKHTIKNPLRLRETTNQNTYYVDTTKRKDPSTLELVSKEVAVELLEALKFVLNDDLPTLLSAKSQEIVETAIKNTEL